MHQLLACIEFISSFVAKWSVESDIVIPIAALIVFSHFHLCGSIVVSRTVIHKVIRKLYARCSSCKATQTAAKQWTSHEQCMYRNYFCSPSFPSLAAARWKSALFDEASINRPVWEIVVQTSLMSVEIIIVWHWSQKNNQCRSEGKIKFEQFICSTFCQHKLGLS